MCLYWSSWWIGTFIAGFMSLGILWPFYAVIPIYAYVVFGTQRIAMARGRRFKLSKALVRYAISCAIILFGIYYLGVGLGYLLG